MGNKRVIVAGMIVGLLLAARCAHATCVGDPGWQGCAPGNTKQCGVTNTAGAAVSSLPDPSDGSNPGITIWTPTQITVQDRDETGMSSSTEYCFGPGYNKTGATYFVVGEIRSSTYNGTNPASVGWTNSYVVWGTGPKLVAVYANSYAIECDAAYNVTAGIGGGQFALFGQLDIYDTNGNFKYTEPIGWG